MAISGIKIELEQGSAEWLAFRKSKIGASDAPIIMGISPWCTPYQLWERKAGIVPEQTVTEAMRRGTQLEPMIREMYNDRFDAAMEPAVYQSSQFDWMIASLDGIFGDTIIEIKCPNADDHATAAKGCVPEKYVAQVQHQLFVTGAKEAHYVSFRDDDMRIVIVTPDVEYQSQLVGCEECFLRSLKQFEPPALSDNDYEVAFSEDWAECAEELRSVSQQIKDLQSAEKKLKLKMLTMVSHPRTRGSGVTVTKVVRKGNIDYSSIPVLKDVDLEEYRKAPVESWRFTFDKQDK